MSILAIPAPGTGHTVLASPAGSTGTGQDVVLCPMSMLPLSPWAQPEQTADTVHHVPALVPPCTSTLTLSLRLCTAVVTLLLSLSPDCSFTCHYRCRALVRLDCSGPPGAGDEDDSNEQVLEKDTNVVGPGPVCEGGLGQGVLNLGAVLCCAV